MLSMISKIFEPAAKLIDEIHVSREEKLMLRNQLAEIESKVAIKTLEVQQIKMELESKLAVAEQEHGNWLSKSWRPLCSIAMVSILSLMSFDVIPFRDLMVQVAGAFLGLYGVGRSFEKTKR